MIHSDDKVNGIITVHDRQISKNVAFDTFRFFLPRRAWWEVNYLILKKTAYVRRLGVSVIPVVFLRLSPACRDRDQNESRRIPATGWSGAARSVAVGGRRTGGSERVVFRIMHTPEAAAAAGARINLNGSSPRSQIRIYCFPFVARRRCRRV